jgi:hypothetical protein
MEWVVIASGFGVEALVGLTGTGSGSPMAPPRIGAIRRQPAGALT